MHVLTKIFIVLVSLAAVCLVPLVVVHAVNEDNFKARWEAAVSKEAAASSALSRAELNHGLEVQAKQSEIDRLQSQLSSRATRISQLDAEVARLQGNITTAENNQAQMNARLGQLASASEAGQRLIAGLVEESRSLRTESVRTARMLAQVEEELRQKQANLDIAEGAVRQLQEEVQRLSEAEARLTNVVAQYVAWVGPLDTASAGDLGSDAVVPVDRNLTATVTAVRRMENMTLVEIDAGQRDGVKVGWVLSVSDGGNYVCRIRIIEVDVNRATGVVELADDTRSVQAGQRAFAFTR